MEYRIVETDAGHRPSEGKEVERYDCAYEAASHIRAAWRHSPARTAHWRLIDADGLVLLGPDDVWDEFAHAA